MQRDNVFRKASCSGVEDVLAIFRQRYLTEQRVTRGTCHPLPRKVPDFCLWSGCCTSIPLVQTIYFTMGFARRATRLNQSGKACLLTACYRSLLAYIFSFFTQARRIPEIQASPSARVIAFSCRTGPFRLGLLGLHFVKPCRWGSALYLKSSISL
jgi:hypothetical protein